MGQKHYKRYQRRLSQHKKTAAKQRRLQEAVDYWQYLYIHQSTPKLEWADSILKNHFAIQNEACNFQFHMILMGIPRQHIPYDRFDTKPHDSRECQNCVQYGYLPSFHSFKIWLELD